MPDSTTPDPTATDPTATDPTAPDPPAPDDPLFLTDGDRPAVRVRRHLDHPVEQVWQAVTDPASLVRWFPAEAEFELHAGGTVTFDPGGEPDTGDVLAADPPHRLVFTWQGDRLDLSLVTASGGRATDFTLVHEFDDRAGAASYATGWERCLEGLADVLAGREPVSTGRAVARHEELVARFGLDRPQVTRTGTGGGWRARWERQLTCPAQTAWDLWFGTDQETGQQRRAPDVGGQFRPYGAPDLVLGTAREVDEPREFAFDAAEGVAGDTVRFRLGPGTGHGARVFLEVTGAGEAELAAAVELWGDGAVGGLARDAAETGDAPGAGAP